LFGEFGETGVLPSRGGHGRDAEKIRGLQPMLTRFLKRFDDCFCRRDTRVHLSVYVKGQLSELPRKSNEPIALAANGRCIAVAGVVARRPGPWRAHQAHSPSLTENRHLVDPNSRL
jgi:hypothetical protein